MPLDVVYILKEDIDPEELRYSLRSLEKNFEHRKVWFIGGHPEGFTPDGAIKHKQNGPTKWDLIKSSMWEALNNEEITDPFFLFNDDFFVMKKQKGEFINFVDQSLEERLEELRKINKWLNPYGRTLYKAQQELRIDGQTEHNFDVHLPMLIHKEGMKAALKKYSSPQMRSLYGNSAKVPFVIHPDVKVYSKDETPAKDVDYLSTNDETFRAGKVGEFIRGRFPKPSRFENARTRTGDI